MKASNESFWVITGAASGIGKSLALMVAQHSSRVLAVDKNEEGLRTTAALHSHIIPFTCDISTSESCTQLANKAIELAENATIVLVNNAGIAIATGLFQEEENLEDFERLLAVNLMAPIRLTHLLLPRMIKQNRGHIVNISSVFGLAGVRNDAAYCTSKFGIKGFTEVLRMELWHTNIGVTCVHPGGIDTNIVRNALSKGEFAKPELKDKHIEQFKKVAKTSPEKAAKTIFDAVRKNKKRVLIGTDAYLIDTVTRLMPVMYTPILKKKLDEHFTQS